jgi:hypothetical protein
VCNMTRIVPHHIRNEIEAIARYMTLIYVL